MAEWHAYASRFPMTPFGGAFLAGVGVCIILGTFVRRFRQSLVWVGFALGSLLILLWGRTLGEGLHAPTKLQLMALVAAIAFEVAGFIVVIPLMRPKGERAEVASTLGIVGLHFLIMIPAFGFLIGLMALGCTLNTAVLVTLPRYPTGVAWFVDGFLKLTLGLVMVATSPAIL